jgi:hypothetical protein
VVGNPDITPFLGSVRVGGDSDRYPGRMVRESWRLLGCGLCGGLNFSDVANGVRAQIEKARLRPHYLRRNPRSGLQSLDRVPRKRDSAQPFLPHRERCRLRP